MSSLVKDKQEAAETRQFLDGMLFKLQESHWPLVVHALRVEGSTYSVQLADQIEDWYQGPYLHATRMTYGTWAYRKKYER